jgi:hypothetical protein
MKKVDKGTREFWIYRHVLINYTDTNAFVGFLSAGKIFLHFFPILAEVYHTITCRIIAHRSVPIDIKLIVLDPVDKSVIAKGIVEVSSCHLIGKGIVEVSSCLWLWLLAQSLPTPPPLVSQSLTNEWEIDFFWPKSSCHLKCNTQRRLRLYWRGATQGLPYVQGPQIFLMLVKWLKNSPQVPEAIFL